MNPFDKYRPDFSASTDLPQWQEMGETEIPNINPLVEQLKKRMARQAIGGTGRSMGNLLHGGGTETGAPLLRSTNPGADAVKPAQRGMQSL